MDVHHCTVYSSFSPKRVGIVTAILTRAYLVFSVAGDLFAYAMVSVSLIAVKQANRYTVDCLLPT